MRFFAVSWAVLLPFYALQQYLGPLTSPTRLSLIAEFLPTYSGILLLLTAEPLLREAHDHGLLITRILKWLDHITERAIYFLAFGHALLFLDPADGQLGLRILDAALAGLGFIFIGRVLQLFGHAQRIWWGFVFASLVYFIAQVAWTVDLYANPDHWKINDGYMIAFAVCKVAFSALFLISVWLIPQPHAQTFAQTA
ncbi:MAG TPA: hypothetical protein VJW20_02260 [Candidatus Angelobacter sp.]|nr:hypothetical protein [Candidatus Angelobacter sp.]